MFNRLYFLFAFIFLAHFAHAQFISKGKIEFERKTNQHALMDENSMWDEMMKKELPKFVSYNFDLIFENGKTLYKPGRDYDVRQNKYWYLFPSDNTVASDLENNQVVTQKEIYGDVYLITDSMRKVNWKIGTEIRKIAGFNCRKAVGKIFDSIVVIAFYTDEILASGGPESFAGLPGMILGLAIPRMHTTWYATKVQLVNVAATELAPPKKGKKYVSKDFQKEMTSILKEWGDEAKKMQWQLLL